MSLASFFVAVRDRVAPPSTQHDLALKAMAKVAEGAYRKQHGPRRPKRNLHRGPVEIVHWIRHARRAAHVPLKYQHTVDSSRYPKAHGGGGQHPGWRAR